MRGVWLKTMPVVITLIAIAGALGVAVGFNVQAQPSGFVLAVSDNNAGLLPIARFDAGKWINTWPAPEDMDRPVPALQDVPTAWLGRRVPRDWRLWFTTGGSVAVRIRGIERSGGCVVSPRLVLERQPQAPTTLYDEVHAGLATTDGVRVHPIHQVTNDERISRDLRALIEKLFVEQQRAAIAEGNKRYPEHWGRVSEADVAAAKVGAVWVYRGGPAGGSMTVYRFEALKPVPDDTELVVHVQGWAVVSDAQSLRVIDADVSFGFAEFFPQGLPGAIPLGMLLLNDDQVWVLEDHHGETADFILDAVNPHGTRRLITTDAGGC